MKITLTNSANEVYLTSEYDPANHWVCNHWQGEQTYVGMVAGANACLALLQQHQCAYLLNDNRQAVGLWDEILEWVTTSWTPRAMAAGLTHFAQVVSLDTLAADSSEVMRVSLKDKFHMHSFTIMAEAQAWLRAAQQPSATPPAVTMP
ncbi:hypothetical protein [Hymenobacter sp. BT730]|uniref:hypothetical protein n=1 Tax=Hymenobacter sp. BT730 TaxID=3063332 RepID=UPI0026DF5AE8|nr:hypothetical protein [Hymenobacter sp. BT730]